MAPGWRWNRRHRWRRQTRHDRVSPPAFRHRCRAARNRRCWADARRRRPNMVAPCSARPRSKLDTQAAQAFGGRGQILPHKLASDAEADDGRHVFGAGAQAAFVTATGDQRPQIHALVQHQRTRALGPAELVRGKRHAHARRRALRRAKIDAAPCRKPAPRRYGTRPGSALPRRRGDRCPARTPVSLLASMTEIRPGRCGQCRRKSASASTAIAVDSDFATAASRCRTSARAGSRTQGCSIAETATIPGFMPAAAPLMNRLLASDPPLVKTTSVGWAPTAAATRCRASSIARRAARPYSCRLDALPNRCEK